ncbi:hypothetical protein H0H81_009050 [Sphagnurus paluster]|uniref:Cyanovirin-N domain-containing protein n=1 Tax=Sphagnurus paluster TaxID=117069 RepID=A0A9P7K444_9AGAR|nr:hypothetical protein H0H81_009050 [Sphagnurus paluster]
MPNFTDTSRDVRIEVNETTRHTVLLATCRTLLGAWHESTLDLDTKIGNDGGSLAYGGSGFTTSSREIYMLDPALLNATCQRGGSWVPASIDLNDYVGNNNGGLVWDYR